MLEKSQNAPPATRPKELASSQDRAGNGVFSPEAPSEVPPIRLGLSGKLLMLTLIAVMAAEIFIFMPSVANFRKNWLMDRLSKAHIASLAAEAAFEGVLSDRLRQELLSTAQVLSVAVKRNDERRLILREAIPGPISGHYDLRVDTPIKLIMDALMVFFHDDDLIISVRGRPDQGDSQFTEIVISEAPLHAAMVDFGIRILVLSIIISLFTAALVYIALNWLLVRPMTGMMRNMVRFRENPEDPNRIIAPSGRADEVGTAEVELAAMQSQLAQMLQQKNHLAALGLAVSKINHDLRNMLANAQLISDSFSTIQDPTVQRFAPKLIGSLDRAIRLCTETLKFGRASEAPPERSSILLRPLVDEVAASLGLGAASAIGWQAEIADDFTIDADRDQLYRVLVNLCRNSLQVLLSEDLGRSGVITVRACQIGQDAIIDVVDNGPGVPDKAREHMFEAFQGSVRKGGTGLGLAIAAELISAHGGKIALVGSNVGTVFRCTIPQPDSGQPHMEGAELARLLGNWSN